MDPTSHAVERVDAAGQIVSGEPAGSGTEVEWPVPILWPLPLPEIAEPAIPPALPAPVPTATGVAVGQRQEFKPFPGTAAKPRKRRFWRLARS